jgi:hypothetical protein
MNQMKYFLKVTFLDRLELYMNGRLAKETGSSEFRRIRQRIFRCQYTIREKDWVEWVLEKSLKRFSSQTASQLVSIPAPPTRLYIIICGVTYMHDQLNAVMTGNWWLSCRFPTICRVNWKYLNVKVTMVRVTRLTRDSLSFLAGVCVVIMYYHVVHQQRKFPTNETMQSGSESGGARNWW